MHFWQFQNGIFGFKLFLRFITRKIVESQTKMHETAGEKNLPGMTVGMMYDVTRSLYYTYVQSLSTTIRCTYYIGVRCMQE